MKVFYYLAPAGQPSKCGVSIIDKESDIKTVVLTELIENKGTPIYEFFAEIATLVLRQLLPDISPSKIKWVEHYLGGPVVPETFEKVNLVWNGAGPGGSYSVLGLRSGMLSEEIRKIKAQMLI